MRDMSIDELRGRSVLDSQGYTLGNVKDLVLDPDRWNVTGVVVELRKEAADDMRLDKPMFGSADLTFRPDRIHAVGDSVILNVDRNEVVDLLRQDRR